MQKKLTRWIPWTLASVAVAGMALSYTGGTALASEHEKELNPKIHRALEALYDAHTEIDHARHGFHGKKREALDVIDHAIDRLKEIKDYND